MSLVAGLIISLLFFPLSIIIKTSLKVKPPLVTLGARTSSHCFPLLERKALPGGDDCILSRQCQTTHPCKDCKTSMDLKYQACHLWALDKSSGSAIRVFEINCKPFWNVFYEKLKSSLLEYLVVSIFPLFQQTLFSAVRWILWRLVGFDVGRSLWVIPYGFKIRPFMIRNFQTTYSSLLG